MKCITERVAAMVQTQWQTALESDTAKDWDWRWDHLSAVLSGMHAGINYFGGLSQEEWNEFMECYELLTAVALKHYLEGVW
jgi:hypothetical protein